MRHSFVKSLKILSLSVLSIAVLTACENRRTRTVLGGNPLALNQALSQAPARQTNDDRTPPAFDPSLFAQARNNTTPPTQTVRMCGARPCCPTCTPVEVEKRYVWNTREDDTEDDAAASFTTATTAEAPLAAAVEQAPAAAEAVAEDPFFMAGDIKVYKRCLEEETIVEIDGKKYWKLKAKHYLAEDGKALYLIDEALGYKNPEDKSKVKVAWKLLENCSIAWQVGSEPEAILFAVNADGTVAHLFKQGPESPSEHQLRELNPNQGIAKTVQGSVYGKDGVVSWQPSADSGVVQPISPPTTRSQEVGSTSTQPVVLQPIVVAAPVAEALQWLAVNGQANFAVGSAKLTDYSTNQRTGNLRDAANKIKAVLADESNKVDRIRITGHTSMEGTEAANLDLSRRRAEAVKTFFIQECELRDDQVEVNWKGETQPLYPELDNGSVKKFTDEELANAVSYKVSPIPSGKVTFHSASGNKFSGKDSREIIEKQRRYNRRVEYDFAYAPEKSD